MSGMTAVLPKMEPPKPRTLVEWLAGLKLER